METEANNLVNACRAILALERPVALRWRRGDSFHLLGAGRVRATCQSWPRYHKIVIARKANDWRGDWRELLAHELAHAFVAEYHPKATDHGRTFQRTAARLRASLHAWGWKLRPLYLRGVDL